MVSKISKSLVSLSVFAASMTTWAATEDVIVVKKPQRVVYEDSSEHNRMDKQFNLNAQLTGLGPVSTAGYGLTGAYFIDSKSLVQLDVVGAKTSESWLSSDYETKTQTLGLYYKRFTGNSFYWKGGLDYTKVSLTDTFDFWSSSLGVRRELEGNLITASFVIGNQWQWDTFTLGCDWIGISAPLSHDTTKKVATNLDDGTVITDEADYDVKRLNEDEKDVFKNVHLQALRFYLGFSF